MNHLEEIGYYPVDIRPCFQGDPALTRRGTPWAMSTVGLARTYSSLKGLAWAKKKLIEGADEVVVVLHRHSSTHGGFDGLRKMMGGWGPNPSKPSKDDCVEQHRNISQGLSLDLVQRGPVYYSEALCFEDVEPSLWMDCRHAAGGAEPDDSLEAERSVERPAVAVPDLDIRPPYSTLERMYDIWKCG